MLNTKVTELPVAGHRYKQGINTEHVIEHIIVYIMTNTPHALYIYIYIYIYIIYIHVYNTLLFNCPIYVMSCYSKSLDDMMMMGTCVRVQEVSGRGLV